MEKVVLLNAAKETSAALGAAIEAVKTMQTPIAETLADREQRLSEGRSSPTGWPIVRQDDGITIPTPPVRLDPPEDPLAPAFGIINGVLLAIPLWALILFIVWGVVK